MDIRLLILLCILEVGTGHEIDLEHLGTVYVPYEYGGESGADTYKYDEGVAEQIAVEEDRHIAYTIGNNLIHVIDFSDPGNPELVGSKLVTGVGTGSLEDITFCKDWVAVCVDNTVSPLQSFVAVYTKFNDDVFPYMRTVHTIEVGSLPDSAKFTSDCSKLLVAIEGEVRNVEGAVVDPEGGVMVIDFGRLGPHSGRPYTKTFVDFTSFNNRVLDYEAMGVRKTFNGQGTSDIASTAFSQDLEPENIAINEDETLAYIPLQENNAMAVLDLTSLSWVDLYPLGTKSFEEGNQFGSKLDASDKDDAINIRHWPIEALFQPDSAVPLQWQGQTYLITANEGDDRSYEMDDLGMDEDWEEAQRGDDLAPYLSDSVPQDIRSMLSDESELGRLKFSLYDGLNEQGKIENLTIFGGRSLSIFRAEDMSLVYDTGSDLAEAFVTKYPFVFNGDSGDEDDTPRESRDSRSDNRGLEPEALELGQINNGVLLFAGLERPGAIAIFSVYSESIYNTLPKLSLVNVYYGSGSGQTWGQLYEDRTAHALGVEDLVFLPADKSPTQRPMLIAAGSVSGTVSFFHVVKDDNRGSGENAGTSAGLSFHMVLLTAVMQVVTSTLLIK